MPSATAAERAAAARREWNFMCTSTGRGFGSRASERTFYAISRTSVAPLERAGSAAVGVLGTPGGGEWSPGGPREPEPLSRERCPRALRAGSSREARAYAGARVVPVARRERPRETTPRLPAWP